MLVSRAGHYYCSCLAVNLLELLKRAQYRYQAVETRRESPGYPQRKPSGSARWSLSEWHTIQSPPDRTGPLWRSRYVGLRVSQKPGGGRQTVRQTDQSNGYGPGLKMLETPDISTLTGAAYVAFRSHLYDSKATRLYCCKVSVGAALVC